MPTFQDLISLVRGPIPSKPLVGLWAVPPVANGIVGGVPDMIRYYFDMDERLRIELKMKELLPEVLVLPGFWPGLGVVVEASAFGGRIVWFRMSSPHIFPCLGSLREVDSIKPPKPGEAGLTPVLLIQMEEMRRKLRPKGWDLDRIIKSMGPAEVCGLLLGYGAYFTGLYDDAKRMKSLMEMVTEFIIEWLHLQEERVGEAELLQLAEHVPNQVSPEHLDEFILPYLKAIYSEFPRPVKIYHNEGLHSDQHIKRVLRFGAEIWHFGSDVHPLSDVYSKIGEAMVPFGGINPHGPMRHGTPEEVKAETRDVLSMAKGRRLLLSTGTGTTPETTLENFRAMVEVALREG